LRKKARGRPQILQRLCLREENFGFFTFCGLVLLSVPSFTRFAVVAKFAPNFSCQLAAVSSLYTLNLGIFDDPMTRSPNDVHALNGIPRCFNNDRA
jgi:hypothetical protein